VEQWVTMAMVHWWVWSWLLIIDEVEVELVSCEKRHQSLAFQKFTPSIDGVWGDL